MLEAGERTALLERYRVHLSREGGTAEAEYLLARALEEPEARIEALRRALVRDDALHSARELLVEALIEVRDGDAALAECARLPALAPGEWRPVYPARVAVMQGRVDDALELVEQAIADGLADPRTRLLRAEVLAFAGRSDEALAELETARRDFGADPQASLLALRIRTLLEAGEDERALDELRASPPPLAELGTAGRMVSAWLRGLAHWQRGELDEAAAALADCPRLELAWMSWVRVELVRAEVLALLGRGDESRALLAEVARADPACDREVVLAARLLLGELPPEEYLAGARRAGVTYDNNAHFDVGLFHELAGREREARAAYRAALETSLGENFPARLTRAALARLGDDAGD